MRDSWSAEKYNCAEAEKMLKMAKDTLTNHKNAYDKCLAEQYALRNARNLEISGCECFTELDHEGTAMKEQMSEFVGGGFTSLEDMKTRMRACPEPQTEEDVVTSA